MNPNTRTPKRPSRKLNGSTILIAAMVVWGMGLHCVSAASPRAYEISSKLIEPTHDVAQFKAEITVCRNNQADGFVSLLLQDGRAFELTPVAVTTRRIREFDRPAVTLVLLSSEILDDIDQQGGAAQPEDFFRATVAPSAAAGVGGDDCDVWDLIGPDMSGGTQVQADGQSGFVTGQCGRDDFGQLDAGARIVAKPQVVFPDDNSAPLNFNARIDIQRYTKARGITNVSFSDSSEYAMFFGAVLPHHSQPFQLFSVGLRSELGETVSTDDMLTATVMDASDDPDCLIWDLVNGVSGEVRNSATFDAISELELILR